MNDQDTVDLYMSKLNITLKELSLITGKPIGAIVKELKRILMQ